MKQLKIKYPHDFFSIASWHRELIMWNAKLKNHDTKGLYLTKPIFFYSERTCSNYIWFIKFELSFHEKAVADKRSSFHIITKE